MKLRSHGVLTRCYHHLTAQTKAPALLHLETPIHKQSLRVAVRDLVARSPSVYIRTAALVSGQVGFRFITDSVVLREALRIYCDRGEDDANTQTTTVTQFEPPYPAWMVPRVRPAHADSHRQTSAHMHGGDGKARDVYLDAAIDRFEKAARGDVLPGEPSLKEYVHQDSETLVRTVPGLDDHPDELIGWTALPEIANAEECSEEAVQRFASDDVKNAQRFLQEQSSLLQGFSGAALASQLIETCVVSPRTTASALASDEMKYYDSIFAATTQLQDPTGFTVIALANWTAEMDAYPNLMSSLSNGIGINIGSLRHFQWIDDEKKIVYLCGVNNAEDLRQGVARVAAEYYGKDRKEVLLQSAVIRDGNKSARLSALPSLICGYGADMGDFGTHNHVITSEGLKAVWRGQTWSPRNRGPGWQSGLSVDQALIEGQLPFPTRVTESVDLDQVPAVLEHPGMVVIMEEFGTESANVYNCFSAEEAAFYFLVCGGSAAVDTLTQYDNALRFGMLVEALRVPVWIVLGHKAAQVALRVARGDATGGGKVGRGHRHRAQLIAQRRFGSMITTFNVDHLSLPVVPVPAELLGLQS